jgi:hypothetical protein
MATATLSVLAVTFYFETAGKPLVVRRRSYAAGESPTNELRLAQRWESGRGRRVTVAVNGQLLTAGQALSWNARRLGDFDDAGS